MVRDPRDARGLARPLGPHRPDGRDECRDLCARPARGVGGRLPGLRLDLAEAEPACARGRAHVRRPVRAAVHRQLRGCARPHAHEEHHVRGHGRGADRHRPRGDPRAARGDLRQEAEAGRLQHEGDRDRLPLREGALRVPAADPRRAHGRHRGPRDDRRQHGRRARLPVRGRDRRRLVPDHAVDLADGRVPLVLRPPPHRPGDRAARLHDRAGRGRARRDRHRDRRDVERRARVHADLRSRHLADGGVHRPRVLRRGAGRAVRRAARRAVDRHADAHAAVRPARLRLRRATATPATCCCSRIPRRRASRWRCRPSTSPSACRRRCS